MMAYFQNVDTNDKAYTVGLLTAVSFNANYTTDVDINLSITDHNKRVLADLFNLLHDKVKVEIKGNEFVVEDETLCTYVHNVILNSKDNIWLTKIQSDSIKLSFIRGYFDVMGHVNDWAICPVVTLESKSSLLLNFISDFTKVNRYEQEHEVYKLTLTDTMAIDFLYKVYKDNTINYSENYFKLLNMCGWSNRRIFPKLNYVKTIPEAIPPQKERMSDSGYDLHLMKKIKEKDGVLYYDTCIKVQPEPGYYFELVGRSSISKTGYMLANNIGIIDASYTGNIIVALVKIRPDAPELTLPCKLVQLIPRKLILFEPTEVENIDETDRGSSGGLGSGSI